MGNQKQKWTAEEEEALLAGVAKHGPGKWKNILKDPHFVPFLTHRSNIDLKDKWRNLSVSTSGQGSKEKLRTSKVKTVTAAPLPNVQIILMRLRFVVKHPLALLWMIIPVACRRERMPDACKNGGPKFLQDQKTDRIRNENSKPTRKGCQAVAVDKL